MAFIDKGMAGVVNAKPTQEVTLHAMLDAMEWVPATGGANFGRVHAACTHVWGYTGRQCHLHGSRLVMEEMRMCHDCGCVQMKGATIRL